MAALVSLAQAKAHLRIDHDHANGDITLKVADATAIVLDYLRGRAPAIASISVANPTVITTSAPHSLTSGVTHVIEGTTTTPTVNGAQIVTVLTPTTFTVPVNVTVGQAAAAGTVGAPAWTEATVPGQVRAAICLWLTHLYEHRGDDMAAEAVLWDATRRLLDRSRDPVVA